MAHFSTGLDTLGFVRSEIARRELRTEDARLELETTAEKFGALGNRVIVASCGAMLSRVEAMSGNLESALEASRRADGILTELGEHAFRSTVQAEIALLSEELGDITAARAAIALADELGDPTDLINHILLNSVCARLALRDDDLPRAESHALNAVKQARATDWPLAQWYAVLALINVHRRSGRREEAIREARDLFALQQRLGDRQRSDALARLIADIEPRLERAD